MKKILYILILCTLNFVLKAQIPADSSYPTKQALGNTPTTIVQANAIRVNDGFINSTFRDTSTANQYSSGGKIKFYPGAQIITYNPPSDSGTLWIRNGAANQWLVGGGSNLVNNNFITTNILGDSTGVVICTGVGVQQVCDTFYFNIDSVVNVYYPNDSTVIGCKAPQVVQVGDTYVTQTICDTIRVPRNRLFIFQQGVQQTSPSIVEHGSYFTDDSRSQFQQDRFLSTFFYGYTIDGFPILKPIVTIQNKQDAAISGSVLGLKHNNGTPSGVPNNTDGLYINRFDPFVLNSNNYGFMGNQKGYAIGTNMRGSWYSLGLDNTVSKQSFIFFHDNDTLNYNAVSIGGNYTPSQFSYGNNPPSDSSLYPKIAVNFKTDQSVQFPDYTTTRHRVNDSTNYKPLVVDASGNISRSFWLGSGGSNTDSLFGVQDNLATADRNFNLQTRTFYYTGTTSGFMLDLTNTNNSGINVTTEGDGIQATSNSGTGVVGVSNIASGVLGLAPSRGVYGITNSNSGVGVYAVNSVGVGASGGAKSLIAALYATNNTSVTMMELDRFVATGGGTPAANIGGSIDWKIATTTDAAGQLSNQLISKWTTATHASRVSELSATGVDNATTKTLFTYGGNGQLTLNQYTTSNFNGGSSSDSVLVVTSAGVVKKRDAAAFASSSGTSFFTADQKRGDVLGTLYSKTNFTNVDTFATSGVTPTISNSMILMGDGTTSLSQAVLKRYTMLTRWTIKSGFKVGLKNGNSYGFNIGVVSANTTFVQNIIASFYHRSSPSQYDGYLNLSDGQFYNNSLATSSSAVSFSQGDSIEVVLTRDLNNFTFTARNVTTRGATVSVSYTYTGSTTAVNTGRPFMYATGSDSVYHLSFYSDESINSEIANVGDSKMTWYGNTIEQSIPNLQYQEYGTVINHSGSGDKTAEVLLTLPELAALKAKTYLITVGSNDIRNGISLATTEANLDSIRTYLTATGAEVRFALMYETAVSQTSLIAWYVANHPTEYIAEGYNSGLNASSTLLGDGIHMNAYGDSLWVSAVGRSGKLYIGTYLNTSTSTTHKLVSTTLGGSLTLAEGSGISLTTTGDTKDGIVTIAATGGGATAYNGLTNAVTGTDSVQLGGTLDKNTTINTTASFYLLVSGSNTYVLRAANSSSGYGLYAESGGVGAAGINTASGGSGVYGQTSDGNGVYGAATTSGFGVRAASGSGYGLFSESQSGIAIVGQSDYSSTNTVGAILNVIRTSSGGAGANGIGGSIDFRNYTSTSATPIANQIISKLTDATNASYTSQLDITGVTSASTQTWFSFLQSGAVKFRPMTVTEAGAIATAEGLMLFVSNTDATFTSVGLWIYQNGAWHAL